MTNWYLNQDGIGIYMSKMDLSSNFDKKASDDENWEQIRDGRGSINVKKNEQITILLGKSMKNYNFKPSPKSSQPCWKGDAISLDHAKTYSGKYNGIQADDVFKKVKFKDKSLKFKYNGGNATNNTPTAGVNDVSHFKYDLYVESNNGRSKILVDPVIKNDGGLN